MTERKIIVFCNAYNCDKYIDKCIRSIIKQRYKNYSFILFNDGSTDKTNEIIKRFIPTNGKVFDYYENIERKGIVHNAFQEITSFIMDDDDIIFFIEGCDWLPHDKVFQQINQYYNDEYLATIGGTILDSRKIFLPNYDYELIKNRKIFYTPITCNAMLWLNINEEKFSKYSKIGCYEHIIGQTILHFLDDDFIKIIDKNPIYSYNTEYKYREKCNIDIINYYKNEFKYDDKIVLHSYENGNGTENQVISSFNSDKNDDIHFIVYASGYNCKNWVDKHIESILNQTYKNFTYIIVDDFTNDGTYGIIKKYNDNRIKLYRPDKNQKWCKNAWDYLRPNIKNDEDVIVVVDLDDWLSHDKVLEKLNKIYKKEKCWLTYGSHSRVGAEKSKCNQISKTLINNRLYRKAPWEFSHLKTFKGFLFLNIKEEDLKDEKGVWLPHTYDKAIMFPMLEMCEVGKVKFIREVLYIYNSQNPLNVSKVNKRENKQTYGKWIRTKKQYDILDRE